MRNLAREVATMTLIAIALVLYGIASLCEGMEILFSAIHAVMTSYPGTLITVAITAYLTYRWYRARYTALSPNTRDKSNKLFCFSCRIGA